MEIKVYQFDGIQIAEVISEKLLVNEVQDALDLMADLYYQGISKIILHEKNLVAGFFDLRTGIAGEILQKFSNYKVQLAIIGDFSKFTAKSLKDFIFESNKHGHVNFVGTFDEAKASLLKQKFF